MLKALIIDDEMYVRRKMSSIVDWAEYDIEIIGEAENGRAALQFMNAHPVDIVFSDLEMPGLNGIPFLKAIREAFPKVRIVVLTMHQEFDYIQRAMHLGVTDYIAKVQIDEKNFGAMLSEILMRMRSLPGHRHVRQGEAYCLYYLKAQPLNNWEDSSRLSEHFFFREVDDRIPEGAVAIHVRGLSGENYRELYDLLQAYVDTHLFYEYQLDVITYAFDAQTVRLEPDDKARILRELERKMSAVDWLLKTSAFESVIALVPALRLPRDTLTAFFYQPFLRCAPYLNLPIERYFDETAKLRWWVEWKAWLMALYKCGVKSMAAEDVAARGIDKALVYIGSHFQENIPIKTILSVAALSKSHFSSLFKERTGMTFVDYIKALRVDCAKAYLRDTGWSVVQVAQKVGYEDERYFRRVFTEVSGVSPSQYRREHQ